MPWHDARVSVTPSGSKRSLPRAALRQSESVSFLELFFDLVFVLALTQATALMAADPSWTGLGRGALVLAAMWWAWVGYAWLTSVVDPETVPNRVVIAGAMAALMVAAVAIPGAFGDQALLFAAAYGVVRFGQLALFWLAAPEGEEGDALRASVGALAIGTTVGVGLIVGAAFTDGALQGGLWALAIAFDMIGPYFFGSEGWRVSPKHFAERHALIIIIALGESIVAIGAGVSGAVESVQVIGIVLGVSLAFALWWMYFDVVEKVASRRLQMAAPGKEQNEIARDSFSYLHFPMVVGIVFVALGLKKTLGHVDEPLKLEIATAMFGGMATYLFAHLAFRWRNVHRFSSQRLIVALLCLGAIVPATEVDSIVALAVLTTLAVLLIVYELWRFREVRAELLARIGEH